MNEPWRLEAGLGVARGVRRRLNHNPALRYCQHLASNLPLRTFREAFVEHDNCIEVGLSNPAIYRMTYSRRLRISGLGLRWSPHKKRWIKR